MKGVLEHDQNRKTTAVGPGDPPLKGGLFSRAPIPAAKKLSGATVQVHLLIGLLWFLILLFPNRTLDERVLQFVGVSSAVSVLCAVICDYPYKRLLRTKRCFWLFLTEGTGVTVVWHAFVGCLLFSSGAGFLDGSALRVFCVLFICAIIGVLVFLERTVVPYHWRKMTRCGRLDLKHAEFHPNISPSRRSRSFFLESLPGGRWRIKILVIGLAAFFLSFYVGGRAAFVAAAFASLVGAFMITYCGWAYGIGIAIRIWRWERANGREILIEEVPDTLVDQPQEILIEEEPGPESDRSAP